MVGVRARCYDAPWSNVLGDVEDSRDALGGVGHGADVVEECEIVLFDVRGAPLRYRSTHAFVAGFGRPLRDVVGGDEDE